MADEKQETSSYTLELPRGPSGGAARFEGLVHAGSELSIAVDSAGRCVGAGIEIWDDANADKNGDPPYVANPSAICKVSGWHEFSLTGTNASGPGFVRVIGFDAVRELVSSGEDGEAGEEVWTSAGKEWQRVFPNEKKHVGYKRGQGYTKSMFVKKGDVYALGWDGGLFSFTYFHGMREWESHAEYEIFESNRGNKKSVPTGNTRQGPYLGEFWSGPFHKTVMIPANKSGAMIDIPLLADSANCTLTAPQHSYIKAEGDAPPPGPGTGGSAPTPTPPTGNTKGDDEGEGGEGDDGETPGTNTEPPEDPNAFKVVPNFEKVEAGAGTFRVSFVNGPPTGFFCDTGVVEATLGGTMRYGANPETSRRRFSAMWVKGEEDSACTLEQAGKATEDGTGDSGESGGDSGSVTAPLPKIFYADTAAISADCRQSLFPLKIVSNTDWRLEFSCPPLFVSTDSGAAASGATMSGDAELLLDIAENTEPEPRRSEIRFTWFDERGLPRTVVIPIVQGAAAGQEGGAGEPPAEPPPLPAALSFEPPLCHAPDEARREWVLLAHATRDFSLTNAAELPEWLTVEFYDAGTGGFSPLESAAQRFSDGQTFRLIAAENTAEEGRAFSAEFATSPEGESAVCSLPITQPAAQREPPPEAMKNALAYSFAFISASGGELLLTGTAAEGWTWEARFPPGADWLAPLSQTAGVGADTEFALRFAIAENPPSPTPQERSAEIAVVFTRTETGETQTFPFAVRQQAGARIPDETEPSLPPPAIRIEGAEHFAFPPAGGEREIIVITENAAHEPLCRTDSVAVRLVPLSSAAPGRYVFLLSVGANTDGRRRGGTLFFSLQAPDGGSGISAGWSQSGAPPSAARTFVAGVFFGGKRLKFFNFKGTKK